MTKTGSPKPEAKTGRTARVWSLHLLKNKRPIQMKTYNCITILEMGEAL